MELFAPKWVSRGEYYPFGLTAHVDNSASHANSQKEWRATIDVCDIIGQGIVQFFIWAVLYCIVRSAFNLPNWLFIFNGILFYISGGDGSNIHLAEQIEM